jgi:lysozyme
MKRLISFILSAILLSTLSASAVSYRGVDIYHGTSENGQITWSTLAKEKQFVYIKASEGTSYSDSMFMSNYAGAKSVKMKWGPYHFLRSYSVSSAKAQADYFWSRVKGTGYSLVPALDFESYDGQTTSSGVRACISAFLNEFYKDSGINCVIYVCPDYITNNGLNKYYAGHRLWQAEYSTSPQSISGWARSIWQYSESGTISAISNRYVDLDYAASSNFFMKYNIYTTTVRPKNNAVTKAKTQVYDANGNIVSGYTIPASTWIHIKKYASTFWEVIYPSGSHWTHGYIKTSVSLKR